MAGRSLPTDKRTSCHSWRQRSFPGASEPNWGDHFRAGQQPHSEQQEQTAQGPEQRQQRGRAQRRERAQPAQRRVQVPQGLLEELHLSVTSPSLNLVIELPNVGSSTSGF